MDRHAFAQSARGAKATLLARGVDGDLGAAARHALGDTGKPEGIAASLSESVLRAFLDRYWTLAREAQMLRAVAEAARETVEPTWILDQAITLNLRAMQSVQTPVDAKVFAQPALQQVRRLQPPCFQWRKVPSHSCRMSPCTGPYHRTDNLSLC